MTKYSSILAWKIPWTEEPGRLTKSQIQLSDRPAETFTRPAETVYKKRVLGSCNTPSPKSHLY